MSRAIEGRLTAIEGRQTDEQIAGVEHALAMVDPGALPQIAIDGMQALIEEVRERRKIEQALRDAATAVQHRHPRCARPAP